MLHLVEARPNSIFLQAYLLIDSNWITFMELIMDVCAFCLNTWDLNIPQIIPLGLMYNPFIPLVLHKPHLEEVEFRQQTALSQATGAETQHKEDKEAQPHVLHPHDSFV